MSAPGAIMRTMHTTLERLVTLKAAATTSAGQIDYVDTLWTTTVHATRRPGDIERCATILDELVTEVATTRALQRPQEPAGGPNTLRPDRYAYPNPQEAL